MINSTLWSQPDDLYYLAALIEQYEQSTIQPNTPDCYKSDLKQSLDFTRRLILLNSGLSAFPSPSQEQALSDFIENFKQLYPHLFSLCPDWVYWVRDEAENLNV